MSLPRSVTRTQRVDLSGGYVEVRGLSIAEHEHLQALKGAKQNIQAIAYATGEEYPAIESWYDTASAEDVKLITDVIGALSGMDDGATFPRRTDNDAVAPRPGP